VGGIGITDMVVLRLEPEAQPIEKSVLLLAASVAALYTYGFILGIEAHGAAECTPKDSL
jgi:hypothetical protein